MGKTSFRAPLINTTGGKMFQFGVCLFVYMWQPVAKVWGYWTNRLRDLFGHHPSSWGISRIFCCFYSAAAAAAALALLAGLGRWCLFMVCDVLCASRKNARKASGINNEVSIFLNKQSISCCWTNAKNPKCFGRCDLSGKAKKSFRQCPSKWEHCSKPSCFLSPKTQTSRPQHDLFLCFIQHVWNKLSLKKCQ